MQFICDRGSDPVPAADQISGTAQFNGLDISGVWSWVTGPDGTAASETPYDAAVKFTPDNTNLNESAELSITVTIEKATPTGEPAFDKISTSGKTLADVNLTVGTITPAGGTIRWVDEEGNELPGDTKVAANKSYAWVYTPADTGNYNELTAQTAKHTVSMPLATPTISSTNYFSGWNLTNHAVAGGEQTTGNLLMALYTDSGRMIACGTCTAFEWINNGTTASYMYLAPEFDVSLLAQADRAVRFRLDASTYAPLSQAKTISAG